MPLRGGAGTGERVGAPCLGPPCRRELAPFPEVALHLTVAGEWPGVAECFQDPRSEGTGARCSRPQLNRHMTSDRDEGSREETARAVLSSLSWPRSQGQKWISHVSPPWVVMPFPHRLGLGEVAGTGGVASARP